MPGECECKCKQEFGTPKIRDANEASWVNLLNTRMLGEIVLAALTLGGMIDWLCKLTNSTQRYR